MKRFTNPFSRLGGKDQTADILEELAELRRDVERLELDMVEFRGELDSFYKTPGGSQVSIPPPPNPEHLLDLDASASAFDARAAAAVPIPKLVEAIPPRVKTGLGEWAQTTIANHPPANFGAAAASRLYVVQEPKIRFKQRGELFCLLRRYPNRTKKHFLVQKKKKRGGLLVKRQLIGHLFFSFAYSLI